MRVRKGLRKMELEKMVPIIGSLILASAYIIGYSYLDGYYEFYDIPLAELSFSIQYIMSHGLSSFTSSSLLMVLAVGAVGAILYLLPQFRGRAHPLSVIVLLLVGVSAFLTVSAQNVGRENAKIEFERLNRVLLSRGSNLDVVDRLKKEHPKTTLHFLVSTGDRHYFVVKFPQSDRRWVIHVSGGKDFDFGVFLNP